MLFKDEFTIKLRCSRDNAIRFLKLNTRDRNAESTRSLRKKAFYGDVKDYEFKIYNQRPGRRLQIEFYGKAEDIQKGCCFKILCKMSSFIKLFFYFGLIYNVLMLVVGIAHFPKGSILNFDIITSVIFIILWFLVFLILYKISLKDGKKQFEKVLGMFKMRD